MVTSTRLAPIKGALISKMLGEVTVSEMNKGSLVTLFASKELIIGRLVMSALLKNPKSPDLEK